MSDPNHQAQNDEPREHDFDDESAETYPPPHIREGQEAIDYRRKKRIAYVAAVLAILGVAVLVSKFF